MEGIMDKSKQSVVLGIRLSRKNRHGWHMLAKLLGVSTNKMLFYFVNSWASEHSNQLLGEDNRKKLGEAIEHLWLHKEREQQ
jgi:hypothetical protein